MKITKKFTYIALTLISIILVAITFTIKPSAYEQPDSAAVSSQALTVTKPLTKSAKNSFRLQIYKAVIRGLSEVTLDYAEYNTDEFEEFIMKDVFNYVYYDKLLSSKESYMMNKIYYKSTLAMHDGTKTAVVGFKYIEFSVIDSKKEYKYIEKQLKKITRKCKRKTDYETIKAVNKYICKIFKYPDAKKINEIKDTRNVHTALKTGYAFCSEYSKLFKMCMEKLGIQCGCIFGEEVNAPGHLWNIVKCDGKWYHIDVCWNDCIGRTNEPHLINTKTSRKEHKGLKFKMPKGIKASSNY